MSRTKIPVLVLLAATAAIVLLRCSRPDSPADGSDADAKAKASASDLDGEATIRGRVFRDGASISAVVELRRVYETPPADVLTPGVTASGDSLLATAETGPDGRFSFERVPYELLEVRARTVDGPSASAWPTPDPGMREIDLEIRLPAAGAGTHDLGGVAVRSDGSPFSGLVGPLPAGDTTVPPFEVKAVATDAQGRFRLEGLPPGNVLLCALAPGSFSHAIGRVVVPHEGDLRLVVDEGATWTEGRVVDDAAGTPVANARVDVVTLGGPAADAQPCFARAATDADGTFRAPVMESFVEVTVHANGYVPFRRRYENRPGSIEIRLTKPVVVTGRVVSAEGDAPVPGVSVSWRPAGAPVAPEVDGGRAKSGPDGRFELTGVAPGRILLYARGAGRVQRELAGPPRDDLLATLGRDVGPAGADAGDLVVVRAGAVEGRVVRQDGTPFAGERVRALPAVAPGGGVEAGADAVTDDDGRFRIEGLVPGWSYGVSVSPEGAATASAPDVVPVSGETKTVDLVVPPARWLVVTVVAKDTGKPVAGARVSARTTDGGGPFGMGTPLPGVWETGADGKARAGPLPPGAITIGAVADGFLPQGPAGGTSGTRVDAGAPEARIELEREYRVAGRVLLPDGSPAAGAWLDVTRSGSTERWRTRVGEDGRFTVGGLGAGTVSLRATRDADGKVFGVRTEVGAGATDVELRLAPGEAGGGNEIVVVVRDPDGGRVDRARVSLDQERESREVDLTGGRLVIPIDPAGRAFMLEVWRPMSDAGPRALPLGAARRGPVPPLPQVVEVVLPPEKAITGRVVDEDGAGVAGVRVRARPRWPGEKVSDHVHGEATTDETGAFRIGQLAETEYRLEFEVPPTYAPADFVDARGGDSLADVVLTKGEAVEVTVLAPDGSPAAGAKVEVRRGIPGSWRSEKIREGVTGGDGKVRIASLDPEQSYRLVVFLETEPGNWEQAALVGKWRPADIVVRTEEPR